MTSVGALYKQRQGMLARQTGCILLPAQLKCALTEGAATKGCCCVGGTWHATGAQQSQSRLQLRAKTPRVLPAFVAGCLMCVCRSRRPGTQWMGTESFLLILAAVVYGYTATVLLFGTMHCLSLVLGECWSCVACVRVKAGAAGGPELPSFQMCAVCAHGSYFDVVLLLVTHASACTMSRACALSALHADITTKDLLTDRQLWRNPPCCPGARSPANLLRSWLMLCCAPTTCRPWQQQQQPQHVWRQLPTAEDALPAEAGGAGGQQEEGTSGSSSGGTGLRMELHESASSIDRHHQQQQPQRPQEEQAGSVSVTVL